MNEIAQAAVARPARLAAAVEEEEEKEEASQGKYTQLDRGRKTTHDTES